MIRWDDREGLYWSDPVEAKEVADLDAALERVDKDPALPLERVRWRHRGWQGLGDVIAAATKLVGIRPCGGCEERRRWLNAKVPFGPRDPSPTPPTLSPGEIHERDDRRVEG